MKVVAAALIAADGRVLLQRRPLLKRHGGLWEYPGGKVEPGESRTIALVRELEEELAISVAAASLEFIAEAHEQPESCSEGRAPIVIALYACRSWTGEPQCLDAEELGWFASCDLPALSMAPLDLELTRSLLCVI